jgi:hypothetical protein
VRQREGARFAALVKQSLALAQQNWERELADLVDDSAASKECTSSVLPCVTSVGPSSGLSFATSFAASRSATEPFHVRSAPLRVATYFVIRLKDLAMSSANDHR